MIIFKIKSGQEFISGLGKYCRKQNIKSGWIGAIGAFESATLAHFNPKSKKYSEKMLNQQLEIAALSGVISICRGKLHFHLHAVLGDNNFRTYSGHLKQGIVNPTAEVAIFKTKQKLVRSKDKKTGLDLLV